MSEKMHGKRERRRRINVVSGYAWEALAWLAFGQGRVSMTQMRSAHDINMSSKSGRSLRRLQQDGFVELDGTHAVHRITAKGHHSIWGGQDPADLWSRPWDGIWRILVFDLPAEDGRMRSAWRRWLRQTGWGCFQKSVWISPDPVDQLANALEHPDYSVTQLCIIEGRPAKWYADHELVYGAWDWEAIRREHRQYCQKLSELKRQRDSDKRFAGEMRAWLRLRQFDPFLPKALLPKDYPGKRTVQLRRKFLRSASVGRK